MKGVPLAVGAAVALLLLPIIAVAALAGALVPATAPTSVCADTAGNHSGTWQAPLRGEYAVTSRFGPRFHPILRTTKLHTGIDLVAKGDPTIVAAASGTVQVRDFNSAYGNQVVIDHGDGIQTRYAHMAGPSPVAVGEDVSGGTRLGLQGATGYATGPHLHFELIKGGRPIDPGSFMAGKRAALTGDPVDVMPASATAEAFVATRSDGERITLNAEQLSNAGVIIRIGRDLGVDDAGLVVALMAALQESGLKNLDYGDRDSLGLFQQRAGWGTARQRQEPEYAARAFFGGPTGPNKSSPPGLLDLDGWRAMAPGAAAQAVQVSAFPQAYDKWEPVARAVLAIQDGAGAGCAGGETSAGQVRVATWNVCLEFCHGGKLRSWQERVPDIATVLKKEQPDIVSLQETGLRDSQGRAIVNALRPEYKLAVYERSKMVLFNPSTFSSTAADGTRLGSVEFVVHGKGGVAQVLRDKRTGRTVVVSSLHPVDGSDEARRMRYLERADAEVARLTQVLPRTVVVQAGDLNATVPDSLAASFFADRGFRSAEQLATTRVGQEWRSYNGGHPPRRGQRIDHVMVDARNVRVDGWRQVLSESRDTPESDHHLIVVELTLPGTASPTHAAD